MSKREAQLEAECKALYSELQTMEQLIQRYQEDLAATGSQYNSKNVRDWYRVEEVLFENQNLSPRGSTMRVELPVMCCVNGEEMQFTEVKLPSQNWEWVSDWYCDIHAYTDESGWVYADSWKLLRDMNKLCCSEQCMSSRVRHRRWKRERMLVGSTGLPLALNESLLTKSRLASMQYATEKLTQQLLRANERIEELEHRNKIYEAQMLKLQQVTDELLKDLYTRSFDRHNPIAMPYDVAKSADVLNQTKALLGDLRVEQGLARFDTLAITSTMQRRQSEVLSACESELQHTIDEFNDLARKLEHTQSSFIEQAKLEAGRPI